MSLFLALLFTVPPAQDIKCAPKRPGFLAGPMVRDEDTAREIFEAVADQFAGGADYSGFQIKVEDSPDHRKWIVYHTLPLRPGERRGGGGDMSMTIEKCTGRISDVHYNR